MTGSQRVLLVEDSPRDAELALKALEACTDASDVVHLRDGAEALEFLNRCGVFTGRVGAHPAVVLLDLKMPRVDGLEVLRQMKEDPDLKTIPVVIFTSSREERDLQACYRLGANAYVVKPVKFQQFVEAVQQVGVFWALVNEPPPGSVGRLS